MNGELMDLPNLNRFDGYPDSGEREKGPPAVLELWQELGYDPAEEDGGSAQREFAVSGRDRPLKSPFTNGAVADPGGLPL